MTAKLTLETTSTLVLCSDVGSQFQSQIAQYSWLHVHSTHGTSDQLCTCSLIIAGAMKFRTMKVSSKDLV